MRIAFPGFLIAALSCSVALGQNVAQPGTAGQPGTAAQRAPGQPGQPGQAQPGQLRAGQGAQATQPGLTRQQGQTLQQGQPGQQGQAFQQNQPGQQGQARQQGQNAVSDQEIAAAIYGGCNNEVELAKFVQSRLQSPEAKKFAERMIKDHTPDCEAYARFAGNLISHGGHEGTQTASHQGGQANWASIHNQLAAQCLQTVQKELSQKEGKELDQCFITQQAMAHTIMKDQLTVFRKHASPQLAQQIDKTLETVNAHLEESKELVKQLEDGPSERVSRRNEGSK